MMHILKCKSCGGYTINKACPKCGKETVKPAPPKYSPEDKYGKYRRQVKFQSFKESGLI
jgi:H/ACA ribonucleoprotein complex subunit 3